MPTEVACPRRTVSIGPAYPLCGAPMATISYGGGSMQLGRKTVGAGGVRVGSAAWPVGLGLATASRVENGAEHPVRKPTTTDNSTYMHRRAAHTARLRPLNCALDLVRG